MTFKIVLVCPEIPPNTGNVIRLAANTGCDLHLIEPLGFSMEDRLLRRAGLDYHEFATVTLHRSWKAFVGQAGLPSPPSPRAFAFTTRATQRIDATRFEAHDCLVFGNETSGLPAEVLDGFAPQQRIRLPMRSGQRSLNLSNAVAVAVYEAWRQIGYPGAV